MKEQDMKAAVRKRLKGGDSVRIGGKVMEILDFYPHGALAKSEKGLRYFFQWDDLMNVKEV